MGTDAEAEGVDARGKADKRPWGRCPQFYNLIDFMCMH